MKPRFVAAICMLLLSPAVIRAQDWNALWKSYVAGFMDNQVRVIDHSTGDRTTSEGQAYGMFFALVANDRSHFDGLLHWTEQNLAAGDLSANLPAWLWGKRKDSKWGVVDENSASDADLWMAYTLLEAGLAWNEPRYTKIGSALAHNIAAKEIIQVPGLGTVLLPGPTGFQHGSTYRLNASYMPLQLILRLAQLQPDGAWREVAASVPKVVSESAPHGFVSDWTEFQTAPALTAVPTIGSYDAIRVYLWAGMLSKSTQQRDILLKSLGGMANYLHTAQIPPAKVRPDGTIQDPKGPVGFSAALIPYADALGDEKVKDQQMIRLQSGFQQKAGLFGNPPQYYDQNLALFGLGFSERKFWFDPNGKLELGWKQK